MVYLLTKEEFIAGWISGMVGITIGHPFDTIKVKQQISKTSILKIIRHTLKVDGIHGFFRGLGVPVITAGIMNSVFFGVYGNVLRFVRYQQGTLDKPVDPYWSYNIMFAGFWGGLAQCFFANPVELIKIRLQTRTEYLVERLRNKGIKPTARKLRKEVSVFRLVKGIYKEAGIGGFYKGFLGLCLRDTPSFGIYMYTFEYLDSIFNQYHLRKNLRYCIAGSIAGVASWIFVIPIDMCKSKIQSENIKTQKYTSMTDCLVKSYKEGGVRQLMKGTSILIIRSMPMNAVLFLTYKKCMEILSPDTAITDDK